MRRELAKSPVIRYGIIAIVWIAWYGLLWAPVSQKTEERELLLQASQMKVENLKKKLAANRQARSKLEKQKKRLAALKKLAIKGENPQVIASNLQTEILTYASKNKIEVVTYRTGSTKKWNKYRLATATFTFKCQTGQLVKLLQFFDGKSKLMRLGRLNIVWVRGRNAHLRVIIDVEALSFT